MEKMELLSCPPFYDEMTIKAGLSGITFLHQNRYKKRYLGSKVYDVLPNGVLAKKEGQVKTSPGNMKKLEIKDTVSETTERLYSVNKSEIRRRLLTFVSCMPEKMRELYFWTISFPKGIEDNIAFRIFNTWLTKLRQRNLLKNYLWVAERQKNGTIHFHLAIPQKLSVRFANHEMMVCICSAARNGEINKSVAECKRYNGVDIAKDRFSRRVTNFAGKHRRKTLMKYLTKYVTKNNTKFSHLAWHNSRGFSSMFTGIAFTIDEFVNKYGFHEMLQKKSVCANEFFMFFPWLNDPPPQLVNELTKLNSFLFSKN